MLILEIALGIVLAVVILAFWRQILGAGILLIGAALSLALVGALLYWGYQHSDVVLVTIGAVITLVLALAVIGGLLGYIAKKTVFMVDEIVGILLVAGALAFVGFHLVEQYERYGKVPEELLYTLPFLGLIVIAGGALVVRVRKRVAAKRTVEA